MLGILSEWGGGRRAMGLFAVLGGLVVACTLGLSEPARANEYFQKKTAEVTPGHVPKPCGFCHVPGVGEARAEAGDTWGALNDMGRTFKKCGYDPAVVNLSLPTQNQQTTTEYQCPRNSSLATSDPYQQQGPAPAPNPYQQQVQPAPYNYQQQAQPTPAPYNYQQQPQPVPQNQTDYRSDQVSWRWVGSSHGQPVPQNPVIAGYEGSTPDYVCRAYYDDGTHPGKLVDGTCYIGYKGKELILNNYEVLTGFRGGHMWALPGSRTGVPLLGGADTKTKFTVCRAVVTVGGVPYWEAGKEMNTFCRVPYGGRAYDQTSYQILYKSLPPSEQIP